MRTNATVIAMCMVRAGDADAAICGVEGGYMMHLHRIRDVLGCASGVKDFSALSLVITAKGHFFLADTQVRADPTAEEIAEMAVLAAAHVRRFGLEPNIALVSHSNFGSFDSASARKMRRATELIWEKQVDFAVDGEMHADFGARPGAARARLSALPAQGRGQCADLPEPGCRQHCLRVDQSAGRRAAGRSDPDRRRPPGHILTPSVTARGIVNMTAVAVVEAQRKDQEQDMA